MLNQVLITENKIEVSKLQWFYRATEVPSDKPPVLLLHGLPAHSYTWRGVMNCLADLGYRAIAPDWIGSGFSAKPDRRDFPYTPEAFLTALGDLIAALKLEKFYLIVQGFLGSVGIQYALEHPEQIERMVILNAPLTGDAKLPWVMKQLSLPFVGDMMTQDPLLVDRTLEKGSGFVVADRDLDVLRKPFLQSSSVGRALMMTLKQLQLKKTTAQIETGLSQWDKPTLILWGAADPWLDTTGVKQLETSRPNIETIELPEAKHYPQEHWYKEITEEIGQFFRRQVL
ncbi:MAG: alpha/beta fold hydrolase [Pleurocapsa sp.]